ncbi:MAG TPA: hypothetical protein VFQ61_07995 [Polyangiaceae bacterium]|nr:hypothetical protein [Polyangiaceae bacterium]
MSSDISGAFDAFEAEVSVWAPARMAEVGEVCREVPAMSGVRGEPLLAPGGPELPRPPARHRGQLDDPWSTPKSRVGSRPCVREARKLRP